MRILYGAILMSSLLWPTGIIRASSFIWTGNTSTAAGGLTWNRPTVDDDPPTYLALVGGGQQYVAQELTVDTTGTYLFAVTANGTGSPHWNNPYTIFGFLYQTSFNPSQPLNNVIEDGSGNPSWSHNLVAGTDYWIVVTGFCGTACSGQQTPDEGPFQASLTGTGNITQAGQPGNTAPEPATFGMLMASLLVIGRQAYRRRR